MSDSRPLVFVLSRWLLLAATCAAIPPPAHAAAKFGVASGAYTGTGSAGQSITGLGFSPAFVIVRGTGGLQTVVRTATMPDSSSKTLGGQLPLQAKAIISLDADGFTVGTDGSANGQGTTYYWTALESTPGTFEVGQYVGDGDDNRNISVGFRPAYLIVLPWSNEAAMQRFDGMSGDASLEFSTSGPQEDRLQALNFDGFQVGSDATVNGSQTVYHYAAWREASGAVEAGTYTGDGAPRLISSPGFSPDLVIVKRLGNSPGALRPAAILGDTTFPAALGVGYPNGIQSFDPLGFRLGTNAVVNKSADTHGYVALRGSRHASIGALSLKDRSNSPASALVPGDTMFVDVPLSVPGGFLNLDRVDFEIYDAGHDGEGGSAAFGAVMAWQRGGDPGWITVAPSATTWTVAPALSAIDSLSATDALQVVRLALVVGQVARASTTGSWSIRASARTVEHPEAATATLSGLDVEPSIAVFILDAAGRFGPGGPGATALPLLEPTEGTVQVEVRSNLAYDLRAEARDMVGLATPTDTIHVGAPGRRVHWQILKFGAAGELDTTMTDLLPALPADVSETPQPYEIRLALDHPAGIPAQIYAGALRVRASAAGSGGASDTGEIPLAAEVVSGGLAALGAIAEVVPEEVAAGTTGQFVSAFVSPGFNLIGDTGIDRVLVTVPSGYSAPTLSAVRFDGLPVLFADSSRAGRVDARLLIPLGSPGLIELLFQVDVPTVANPAGDDFAVQFDDSRTLDVGPQGAREGDANPLAGENGWHVTIVPGPASTIRTIPPAATLVTGDTMRFSATIEDIYGNTIDGGPAWSALGAAGSVDPVSGLFTASSAGTGGIIATAGSASDTSEVTVFAPPAVLVRAIAGPASVTRGQNGFTFSARIENPNAETIRIDSLVWSMTRVVSGDANADFAYAASASNPDTIPAGGSAWLVFDMRVLEPATPGSVTMDARVHAVSVSTSKLVVDVGADSVASLDVQDPPLLAQLPGSLAPATVTPGETGVTFLIQMSSLGGATVASAAGSELRIVSSTDSIVVPLASFGAVWTFGPTSIPTGFASGRHPVRLALSGVDSNGAPFSETLWAADSLEILPLVATVSVTGTQTVSQRVPGDSEQVLLSVGISHDQIVPVTLQSFAADNTTLGPGGTSELDAEFTPLGLYLDDGNGAFDATTDVLLSQQTISGGQAVFGPLSLSIPAGVTRGLFVTGAPSVRARDADSLDLRIGAAANLVFDRTVLFTNAWPVDPPGRFAVDGMSAAQIVVRNIPTVTLFTGTSRNLAFDFVIPANGYAADTLHRLNVTNSDGATGTAGDDLERLEAWVDDGDGMFDPSADRRLGAMSFTGDRWELTGLHEAVPLAGLRVFVTCDIADLASEGRTIRLEIPALPDVGLGMASSNDGPIDRAAAHAAMQVISNANRVTLTSAPLAVSAVSPGEAGVPVLHLSATNTYGVPKSLASLAMTHATTGAGTQNDFDRDLTSISLRSDGDGNGVLGDETLDPVLATGFFVGGRATFAGLNWTLAPGETRELFVTAQLSLGTAADGDIVEVRVAGPGDAGFSDETVVTAGWPLTAGGGFPIDGMVARQVTNFGVPVKTIGAGEGPALALDVRVPRNGYRDDALRGVTLSNLGNASPADLAELRLWRDGGDGLFDAGGADDANLGLLVFSNGRWTSPLLAVPLALGGARLFVSAIAASQPTDSVTLRLAIARDGIAVDSNNDGPIDTLIANPVPLLISNALLLADLAILPGASTISQTVTVRMDVRNVGTETIAGVVPGALTTSGTATMQYVSGPAPGQLDLDPGTTGSFLWTYRADGAGTFQVTGNASGIEVATDIPRRSLETGSDIHRVYVAAQNANLFPVESMPFSVNRGQAGVVPLSLTLQNPAGPGASDVRLLGLRVQLMDEFGAGIVPSDLLSRIVVSEGADVFVEKTSLETTGNEIDLTLAQPALIPPGGTSSQITLNLALDISGTTTVPRFRLAIVDASAFVADDATSGAPIVVQIANGSFPVRSGLAQVGTEALELNMTAAADSARTVGRGQTGVVMLGASLSNVDASGLAADIRVSSFDVGLVDSSGQAIAFPGSILRRIRVRGPVQTHLDRLLGPTDDTTIRLSLSPSLTVQSSGAVPIEIEADIHDAAPIGAYALVLVDSAAVVARDANTNVAVTVRLLPAPLSGGQRLVRARADSAWVRRVSGIAPAVTVGQIDVPAMGIRLIHPGPSTAGAISISSVTLETRDQLDNPVPFGALVDRLTVSVAGQTVGFVNNPAGAGNTVTMTLSGVALAPTDSLQMDVRFDVEPTAPQAQFKFELAATGILAWDANLGTSISLRAAPGSSLPFGSGITGIQPPARELVVTSASLMPPTLVADGQPVPIASLTLLNTAAPDAGDVRIDHLDLDAADVDHAAIPLGDAVAELEAWIGGQRWVATGPLAPGAIQARLSGTDTLRLEPQVPVTIEIRMVVRTGAVLERGVRLGCTSAGIGVVQPSSALLAVAIRPAAGQTFPFWTESGTLSETSLAGSFTNFPNPFAAGRAETRFAFYLPSDARITLRVWTARGERVRTVIEDAPYGAGLHQSLAWDGRNGAGASVQNGIYGAELIVRYVGGSSDRQIRKVAVVR
jgi:hypothetical protein